MKSVVKLLGDSKKKLSNHETATARAIDEAIDEIVAKLAEKRKELKEKAGRIVSEAEEKIVAEEKNAQLAVGELESLLEFMSRSLETATDQEVLSLKKQVSDQVARVTKLYGDAEEKFPVPELPDLVVECGERVKKAIESEISVAEREVLPCEGEGRGCEEDGPGEEGERGAPDNSLSMEIHMGRDITVQLTGAGSKSSGCNSEVWEYGAIRGAELSGNFGVSARGYVGGSDRAEPATHRTYECAASTSDGKKQRAQSVGDTAGKGRRKPATHKTYGSAAWTSGGEHKAQSVGHRARKDHVKGWGYGDSSGEEGTEECEGSAGSTGYASAAYTSGGIERETQSVGYTERGRGVPTQSGSAGYDTEIERKTQSVRYSAGIGCGKPDKSRAYYDSAGYEIGIERKTQSVGYTGKGSEVPATQSGSAVCGAGVEEETQSVGCSTEKGQASEGISYSGEMTSAPHCDVRYSRGKSVARQGIFDLVRDWRPGGVEVLPQTSCGMAEYREEKSSGSSLKRKSSSKAKSQGVKGSQGY